MDLQTAKALNARMWLFAKLSVIVCFGLASMFLAASLWQPAKSRADLTTSTTTTRLSAAPAALSPC